MGFVYNRTIALTRPQTQGGAGAKTTYAGQRRGNETPTLGTIDPTTHRATAGIPASIQARREGQNNPVGLPSDGTNVRYHIYLSKRFGPALGAILANDTATDDLGVRYQVLDPGWDSLGYRMTCILLTA